MAAALGLQGEPEAEGKEKAMSGYNFATGRKGIPQDRVCKVCGKTFEPQSRNQRYCSAACKRKARKEREGRCQGTR